MAFFPTAPKRGSSGWKIWLGFAGIVIVVAVLSEEWRTIDKYFPALNRFIHSATPTTRSDLEYTLVHFGADADQLDALCMTDFSSLHNKNDMIHYMKDCRTKTLAAKPALNDLHEQFQKIKTGWEKKTAEVSVPTECKNVMGRILTCFGNYISVADEEYVLWESTDPSSATGADIGRIFRRLAEFDQQAAAAQNQLKEIYASQASDVCKNY